MCIAKIESQSATSLDKILWVWPQLAPYIEAENNNLLRKVTHLQERDLEDTSSGRQYKFERFSAEVRKDELFVLDFECALLGSFDFLIALYDRNMRNTRIKEILKRIDTDKIGFLLWRYNYVVSEYAVDAAGRFNEVLLKKQILWICRVKQDELRRILQFANADMQLALESSKKMRDFYKTFYEPKKKATSPP